MTTWTTNETVFSFVGSTNTPLIIAQVSEDEGVTTSSEVRIYAGGRKRTIISPGNSRTINLSYSFISRSEYNDLVSLIDTVILFRDQRGRRVFGIVTSVNGIEWAPRDRMESVTLSVQETYFSEVV
jgi:hypothetical protein